MLPLETKATIAGLSRPALLKLAGTTEIAEATLPFERMAPDLRALPREAWSADLLDLPWAAFVGGENDTAPSNRVIAHLAGDARIAKPGDVIELDPYRQRVAVRYRRGDNGNVLFATERCNSFCLMCSQPPRQVEDNWRVQHLCELVELIDRSEPSLAISGGEPTLLGTGLGTIIARCAEALPDTHIHVLSNGRLLSDPALTNQFEALHPHLTWGVPLYGDHYALHDYMVQSEGAFAQTIRGLYALEAARQRVEIRVVLVRPSFERLEQITRFILRNLSFVEHVALMGIEPIGFAKAHHAALWADPADYTAALEASVDAFSRRGMAVSLYNLPLCTTPACFGRMRSKASPIGKTTTSTPAQAARRRVDVAASSPGSPPNGRATPSNPLSSIWRPPDVQRTDPRHRHAGRIRHGADAGAGQPAGAGGRRQQVFDRAEFTAQ